MRFYFVIIFAVFAASCGMKHRTQGKTISSGNRLKYALGFSMVDTGNCTLVEVYNPWSKYEILERYVFSEEIPDAQFPNAVYVKTPVDRSIILSSTYLGMISELNARNAVIACSNASWIYDSALFDMYQRGKLLDLGSDLTVSPEPVLALNPTAVVKYIYIARDALDEVLKNAGVPVIYNIEFMEGHPLGRTEWIKLFGVMLGKRAQADSIFSMVEQNYLHYSKLAQLAESKKTALIGSSYKGTWFAVGGNSYVSKLLRDANIDYYWSSDSSTGGLPLNFESVLLNQKEADIWINANASSLKEILTVEPRCEVFKAFQQGEVYHYNKRINPNGGLDYYESGVVRPDILLYDLIKIAHPELADKPGETIYWKKLE